MNIWRRLGIAGLVAGALAFGGQAHAACISSIDGTVDDPADCVFGDGGEDDCRLAISIDWDGAGNPPPDPKKMVCTDGDPTCDRDGFVNGRCEFLVGACVNLPGCAPVNVASALVTKPSQKEVDKPHKTPQSAYTRNDLQYALNELLPSSTESCTADDISIRVPLKSKGGFCGPASPPETKCVNDGECVDYCVPVFKKNKVNVALELDETSDAKAKFKFTCNPDEDGFTNGAQAFQVSSASDLIGGALAMGKIGDYVIRNGNVRALARAPGRAHSFMLQNGGQIIDADLHRIDPADDRDSWQGMQPMLNTASSQATSTVSVGTDGVAAIIHSEGEDELLDSIKGDVLILAAGGISLPQSAIDVDLPIQVETDLILPPYSNTIEVATTVTNTSGSTLNMYIGDFINPSGQLEPFGPGQGYGEQQLRNGTAGNSGGQPLQFMAYQGMLDAAGVTYGLIFPSTDVQGTTRKTGVFSSSGVNVWVHNNDLLNGVLFQPVEASKQIGGFAVPAMGEKTLRRWFTIGETVNDVTKQRASIFNEVTSIVQGVITVNGEPAAGAHVTVGNDITPYASVCDDYSTNCKNVYSSTLTDESGFYRMTLPVGNWNLFVRKAGAPYEGGTDTPTAHAIVVEEKKPTLLNVDLPGTGTIVVNVEDQAGNPVAAKVSVVGVPASPDPLNEEYTGVASVHYTGRYFGYDFEEKGDVFGLAEALFADTTGTTGEFNLEPGSYHVVVSKGYEYDVYDEPITVTAGNTNTVNAVVNRVVDTTGFVSIDTHVHMLNSPDSTISRKGRINTMIAEGVDFFVNTDHDFAHDLSDEIAEMGVGSLVANRPSAETTTSHYGHFNMWPITVDSSKVDGGDYDWSSHNGIGDGYPTEGVYDSNPSEIFAAGHAYPGTQVVQINHFNSGTLGHFNSLGIDTAQNPPVSSNEVYRCVGGTAAKRPCRIQICIDGTNDGNACTMDAQCPGGACPTVSACDGGGTCQLDANLGKHLRLDPAQTNFYDDGFTALEVWIEAGIGQTNLLLGDNMADWFNLMNQGRFKAGVADSDTHSSISVQSGGPRTFVASSTDAPASIDPEELAVNVNAMRAIGSNGPFMRVELENGTAQTASHAIGDAMTVPYTGGGADSINLHIEAPTWAEYDTIDIYMNSTTNCESEWTFFGVVNPSKCDTVNETLSLTKGVDFTVNTVAGVSGSGQRQVTDVSVPVTISQDTWVVVVVKGTDGNSAPMFPMLPQDLQTAGNDDLADLTDNGGPLPWNQGEDGALALAFSNPLFFDDGDNVCHGGTACP